MSIKFFLSCFSFLVMVFTSALAAADFNRAVQNFAAERYAPAIAEFTQLAALGHAGAQFNLAAMHVLGQGAVKDNIEAYAWISLVAEDGDDATAVSLRDKLWSRFNDSDRPKAQERAAQLQTLYSKKILQQTLWPNVVAQTENNRPANPYHNVGPEYPKRALNLRLEGAVDVEYSLDRDGYITDYAIAYSTDKIFNAATLKAVKTWRFEPWVIGSERVPVVGLTARIHFRTDSNPDIENIEDVQQQKILNELRLKAEAGEPVDMYNYAYIGSILREQPLPPTQANKWYLRAAQAGLPEAQYQLGRHLHYGFGCELDVAKARQWLTLAADAGMPAAQYFLAENLLSHETEAGIEWLEKAAAAKLPRAVVKQAWMLATHKDESRRDGERALALINGQLKRYPDQLSAQRTLAASQAATGDFSSAVATQEEVIKLAKSLQRPIEIEQQRLVFYRAKNAWQE